MPECGRGIDDFLSLLPQAPVPLAVLEAAVSEKTRIEALTPLEKRRRGAETFIHDFIITFDGTVYGLRFADDEWTVIAASDDADEVALAMESEENRE